MEAARDLRHPDFLPFIVAALSSPDFGVWESLLHDSMSPKLLMQGIREEAFRRGLGVVGHIPILADIWNRYVPEWFASVASRHFSGVGPPSDEALVMWHALRSHNLLFPLPPVVNLVPVNRDMPERPEKFLLPSVEVLALLVQVAQ